MRLLTALLRTSPGTTAARALHTSDTLAKSLVAGGSFTGARQQQQPSRHVDGRSSATAIAPPGARLFSSGRSEPPVAESSFLQSIDLSHPNAADRQKLSKLIQEVVKTKANTGGAFVRASLCVL